MKRVIFTIALLSISIIVCAQSIPITGDQYHYYGSNSTWGEYLKVGGNGRGTANASVVSTNGNLHLDSKDGRALYLNHYSIGNTYINPQGGFVGIGTSSPGKPLHISSSVEHHQLRLQGTNNKHAWLQYYPSGSGVLNWQTGVNTNGFSVMDLSNSQYRLTINNSGNIGIGTTNPLRDLHLAKSNAGGQVRLQVENSDNTNSTSHGAISVYSGGSNGGDAFLHFHPGIGSGEWTVGVDNSNDDKFKIGSNFTVGTATALTIDHNLNVGIGTTTPLSKLSVNGYIRATEIKVLANVNVPDYVFEPDYELRSLKETKEYITANKHLPEIPSAAEIVENGIDLGDMNMRLLKKIEELTLYQIELMEKLEKQNVELQEVKKEVQSLKE